MRLVNQAIQKAHEENNHSIWDDSDDTDPYYECDALIDAKFAEPCAELKLSFTLTPDTEKQSKGTVVPIDKYDQVKDRYPELTEEEYWEDETPFYNWDDAVTVELEPKG